METMPFGCGMMGMTGGPLTLCEGLQRLKDEHPPLRKQMEELFKEAQAIGDDAGVEDWEAPLRALEEKVKIFVAELDPHSKREEDVLFPLMAKHIGREMGPIAVMEYEHEQAKTRLTGFLATMASLTGPIKADTARRIAGEVAEAVQILFDHFMKEENVLFPMAERILSDAEKEELLAGVKASG